MARVKKLACDNLQNAPVDPVELRNAAKRALLFQRYILRRAFGILYAISAFALAIEIILPFALQPFLGTSSWFWFIYAAAVSIIGIMIAAIPILILDKATRTIALRNAMNSQESSRRNQWILTALYAVFYVLVAACFVIFTSESFTIIYGLLIGLDALVIIQLMSMFSNDIPIEGKIAALAFGASAVTSFVLSILVPTLSLAAPWIILCFVWLFCALYALKKAPEEWVEWTD